MELKMLQVSQESGGRIYRFSTSFSEGIHILSGSDANAKTLLLKLLTGRKPPDHGEIRFLGYNIIALGRAYQNHLAYLSRFPLFPDSFSLSHYLIYTGILQRLEPERARAKAASLMSCFDLDAYAGQPLGSLPDPVKKRVLLVNTLHSEAPILLLDNLFSYVSANSDAWVFAHLQVMRERKIILISAQQAALPDEFPHRTLYLEDGSIREKAPV